MNNKKKLPLGEALTSTYLYDAYPLSVLPAHGNDYLEWFLSNYIQLNANKDIVKENNVFLEFYGPQALKSPFLNKQNILWSAFTNLGINVHDYVKLHIDQEYYIYCQVDEYYIPNRQAYQAYHFIHDLFVYGYNDIDRIYYILGYNKDFIFSESTCSYNDFEKGFRNNFMDKTKFVWSDKIRVFQYNNTYKYHFNLELVKHLLTEYLSGQNSYETLNRFDEPRYDRVYGIDVFDKVLEHLTIVKENSLSVNKSKEIYLDNRIFRLIMEHKKIMMMRMKYINEHFMDISDLLSSYKQVEEIAGKNHGISIKFRNNENVVLLDKLKENIKLIVTLDREVLQALVEKIGRNVYYER